MQIRFCFESRFENFFPFQLFIYCLSHYIELCFKWDSYNLHQDSQNPKVRVQRTSIVLSRGKTMVEGKICLTLLACVS